LTVKEKHAHAFKEKMKVQGVLRHSLKLFSVNISGVEHGTPAQNVISGVAQTTPLSGSRSDKMLL